jgi:3-phenylpropionate/cinnamic acid dioxygenase small subunit
VSAEAPALARLLLQREIEDFLYGEVELLDTRRFEEWLDEGKDTLGRRVAQFRTGFGSQRVEGIG